jgi:hypothetical protein
VRGDAHPLAVAKRAAALLRGEEEVAQRLVNQPADHLPFFAQADRDRPDRKVLQVVRRAVERVDDPDPLRLPPGLAHPAFFAEEGVARLVLANGVDDGRFGLAVGGRNPIVARLQVRVVLAELLPVPHQHRGAAPRGFGGDFEVVHVGGGL